LNTTNNNLSNNYSTTTTNNGLYMPKGNSLDIINSDNPLIGDLDFTASSHHVLVPTATTGD